MTWDEASETYTLSTGRQGYANNGILGLGPDIDDDVSEGYDGVAFRRNPWNEPPLSLTERQEIAAFMIARWQAWGDHE